MIKSRKMRWAGHVACMEEKRNKYIVLVGKPEGKRKLERLRRRWEDNMKTDLAVVGWESMACIRDKWRGGTRRSE
jgi:hypothetical protein